VDSLEAGPIEHHHRVLVDLHHAHLPHRVRGEVEIVEVAEEFLSAGYRAIGEEALELRRHVPTEKLLVITDRCLPTGPLERRQFREQALICGVLGKGSGENTTPACARENSGVFVTRSGGGRTREPGHAERSGFLTDRRRD
jgi:hypothetical protein